MDQEARQCLPDCSGHGDFDLESQKCVCRGHWTGSDCSKGKSRRLIDIDQTHTVTLYIYFLLVVVLA